MPEPNTSSMATESIFLSVSVLINMLILPVACFKGVMATDSSDGGMLDILMAFLFVEGIPLFLLAISLYIFVRSIREKRKSEDSSTERGSNIKDGGYLGLC